MEVNSNLDSNLLKTLEQLKGKYINFFAGINLNVYQKDNTTNYQFHSGIYISAYSSSQDTMSFFFNGKIVEDNDGRDRFYFKVITASLENESLVNYSVLYPRFIQEGQTLNYHIKDIVLYSLVGKVASEIFAIHFMCKHEKDFVIRFEFPADGLHLSTDKNEISSFFSSDSFGKKLKPYPVEKLR